MYAAVPANINVHTAIRKNSNRTLTPLGGIMGGILVQPNFLGHAKDLQRNLHYITPNPPWPT